MCGSCLHRIHGLLPSAAVQLALLASLVTRSSTSSTGGPAKIQDGCLASLLFAACAHRLDDGAQDLPHCLCCRHAGFSAVWALAAKAGPCSNAGCGVHELKDC